MPVPAPGWGQHDIAGRHIDALSVHHGIDILGGIEHETQRSRGMAMRTRGLTGLDHLIGGDDREIMVFLHSHGVGTTRASWLFNPLVIRCDNHFSAIYR